MASESNDAFLLGRIEATVTGTAEDVKAIRQEVGDLARRVGATEQRVEAIEAERHVLVPQYTKWKHDISNEVQTLAAWKHQQAGAFAGGSVVAKLLWGLGGAVIAFLVSVGVINHGKPVQPNAPPPAITNSGH